MAYIFKNILCAKVKAKKKGNIIDGLLKVRKKSK